MASFVIPTIFTAINRFSGPANQVAASMQNVASTAGRAQVALSTFSPLVDKTTTGLLSFARSAVMIGGILGGITFSAKSIIDYDKAVSKFRIVVDDISEADFSKFKFAIKDVADATKSSMVDVANAFESIAQISPEFAKTPALIDAVTKSAITLSRASGMELKPAAEALTTIMNQNKIQAQDSEKVINILAASQAIGAASINQLAEAYKNFGAIGVQANITLERSNAIFQVLAKNGLYEAEAGTKARRAILELQASGVGYKSGKFDVVEALATTKSQYDLLGNAMAKDAFLLKRFGEQGVLVGQILVGNIPLLKEYEQKVTGTNEANIQAAITTSTMAFKLEALKNAFQNVVITSSSASVFTGVFGGVISFLTNNMNGLLNIATTILVPLALFKGALMAISFASRAASFWVGALSFAEGVLTGATNGSVIALGRSSAALAGYNLATQAAARSTLMLNLAVGAGALALVGFFSYVVNTEHEAYVAGKGIDELSQKYDKLNKSVSSAELALRGYNDIQARRTERESILKEAEYEWKKGGLFGTIASAWLTAKATNIISPLRESNINSEIKNLGLENQFANPTVGQAYADSLTKEIESMKQSAVDSASGRNPVTDIRNSTNVAAPIVYNTVNVDSSGNVTIDSRSLPAKQTTSTSKWLGQ